MATAAEADRSIDTRLKVLVWVLVLGGLAPALDTTVVNVALDAIGRSLHVAVATSQWTITGYLLTMGMAMPITRWAAERFGAKRVWLASLALFVLGSALSGAAWSAPSLIAFRLFQGFGAGLMMPVMTTLLVQGAGPGRLGQAMATAMLPVAVVPVFGPTVGGLIVDRLSWHWIFYINVPICVAALLLARRVVPETPPARRPGRLDLVGLTLLSPGLALLIDGLAQASGGGFAQTAAAVPLLAGLALVSAFALYASRLGERALVNVRVLAVRTYSSAVAVLLMTGVSVYGPLLLLALFYQDVRGLTAMTTGLLLGVQGVGSLLPRSVGGRLADRVGPRPVVIAGLALTVAGTLPFAWAGAVTSPWLLGAALFVRGAGLAGVSIAVMVGAFRDLPPARVPDASSTTRIVQQVGGSLGAAVLIAILAAGLGHGAALGASASAFDGAFRWAAAFGLLTVVPALALGGGRRNATA